MSPQHIKPQRVENEMYSLLVTDLTAVETF